MQQIPFFHSYCPTKRELVLRGAQYFPREVFNFADQIEILDVADGTLTELPADFARLHKLRIAFFSRNPFSIFPQVLCACESLRVVGFKSCSMNKVPEGALPRNLEWLILTDNYIEQLPDDIGTLRKLRKCALAGNQLAELPHQMAACQNIELLRLGANKFRNSPPAWIFSLPKLAWYCDSGNPFHQELAYSSRVDCFAAKDFLLGAKIGASPTSDVYRATRITDGLEVAIKFYKSRLTSDGYASDDMKAYFAMGKHPKLIEALGQLESDSEVKEQALVLRFISSDYRPLGLPPSLESCTRDRFESIERFSPNYILTALRDVATAVSHLHQSGISHGDLYAHNILSNAIGESIVGDFGAASRLDSATTTARECIEVRAFGLLIDDLLSCCHSSRNEPFIAQLRELQQQLCSADVLKRPCMQSISRELDKVQL